MRDLFFVLNKDRPSALIGRVRANC